MSWDERIADMACKINQSGPIESLSGPSVSLYGDYTKLQNRNCESGLVAKATVPQKTGANPFSQRFGYGVAPLIDASKCSVKLYRSRSSSQPDRPASSATER